MKFKPTYSFAFWSSIILTLVTVIIAIFSYFLFFEQQSLIALGVFVIVAFIFSFAIIQYRTEKFIYNRIKNIYNSISFLDRDDFKKEATTTNLEELSKTVQQYVEGKRIEIENLTERDSFRRDFLGNVAHELKTPLFTVQGYVLTLIEGAVKDSLIRDKYLDRANKGVERLISIVKDLDMIAKLETEGMKLKVESFNILEIIQNVFDLLEMRAKKRGITLQFDEVYEFPVHVQGDVEKIEQVLINLIVNSIKYGKINGTTTVGIESYNEHKIIVKVTDNGEGIKQENLSRLFERFYRVDQSRSRDQGGSGLGLSIVKHIIEAHNETILIQSTYGEGSEFSFTLEKVK